MHYNCEMSLSKGNSAVETLHSLNLQVLDYSCMFGIVLKARKHHAASFSCIYFHEKQASAACLKFQGHLIEAEVTDFFPLLKDDQQQRKDLKVRIGA